MRAKIILPAAAVAAVVLLLAFHYKFAPVPPAQSDSDTPSAADAPAPPDQPSAPAHKLWAVTERHSDETIAIPAATDVEAYGDNPIEARVSQLSDLATSNDPVCLKNICADLNNQNSQIRQAALNAVIQYGSADAIPDLRNAIQYTDDPREKVALQDAIDELQMDPPPAAPPSSDTPPAN